MGFVVAISCPQCGGEILCAETDRLFRCPYCSIRNFLTCHDFFRYMLPWKKAYDTFVFVPYLRFRGAVYLCRDVRIDHRIVDMTHLATPLNILPPTLGLRPQAMKMRFVDPTLPGLFLKCFLTVAQALVKTGNQLQAGKESAQHRAYIGETMSLIYQPLAILEDRIIDAITDSPVARISAGVDLFKPLIDAERAGPPTFLAAICPRCGSDLSGEKDSIVLICINCQSAWEVRDGNWARVESQLFAAGQSPDLYLPFWRMTVSCEGLGINSYADFLRVSNQPKIVSKESGQRAIYFWAPGFKIIPKIFLRLAGQLTIAQPDSLLGPGVPSEKSHPVTLPKSEAIQSLKVILAYSSLNKKDIMPQLPGLEFVIKDATLIYLPFIDNKQEFYQERLGLHINRQSLAYGRLL